MQKDTVLQSGAIPTWSKACTKAVKSTRDAGMGETYAECDRYHCVRGAAERGGADGIVAINTVKAMRISTDLKTPGPWQQVRRIIRSGHIPYRGPVRLRDSTRHAASRSSVVAGSHLRMTW